MLGPAIKALRVKERPSNRDCQVNAKAVKGFALADMNRIRSIREQCPTLFFTSGPRLSTSNVAAGRGTPIGMRTDDN